MRGISIADLDERQVLKIDLRDILRVVGKAAQESTWSLIDIEALGEAEARELHRLSDEGLSVDGTTLARLASRVSQVIDGELRAFRRGSATPWLIIRAVDSSAYDVLTDDDSLLARLREKFTNVDDIRAPH